MDLLSFELIIRLQLEDSQEMAGQSKGKQPEGTFNDAELALQLYIEDIENTITTLKGRKMAQSFAKSVMEDSELIEQMLKEDQQVATDRVLATSIRTKNGGNASFSKSDPCHRCQKHPIYPKAG
ncbi:hypothetical protein KC330_g3300 [Hortaea werneckii]|nr:hypothetical protein KC330_g3300 [Hortaea werneckii]